MANHERTWCFSGDGKIIDRLGLVQTVEMADKVVARLDAMKCWLSLSVSCQQRRQQHCLVPVLCM